jgi:hypothetical protein
LPPTGTLAVSDVFSRAAPLAVDDALQVGRLRETLKDPAIPTSTTTFVALSNSA